MQVDIDKIPLGMQEALDELQAILQQLESGDININELPSMVKRAKFLGEFCENELTRIENLIRD